MMECFTLITQIGHARYCSLGLRPSVLSSVLSIRSTGLSGSAHAPPIKAVRADPAPRVRLRCAWFLARIIASRCNVRSQKRRLNPDDRRGRMMRYTYTAAWAVVGGISLRKDSSPIVLASSESARFILTRDPDALLAKVDEASAVGRLMLKGLASQSGPKDFQTALASEIEEIKAERKKKTGAHDVLLFQAHGDIEASVQEPLRDHDTFIVTFDAIEQNSVRQLHKHDIEDMKVAVAFESDAPSRFAYLADGTYLLNNAEKPVYSISFSMSGEASVSTPLSSEATRRITDRYAALSQENDLDSVERLFSQMAEYGTDRLKAFPSGWAPWRS